MTFPSSRKEALEQGVKYFFTGRPCKHGHLAKRLTSRSTCSACSNERAVCWVKANPEKRAALARRYNQAHQSDNWARAQKWREANPDAWSEIGARSYLNRKDDILPKVRLYREQNGEKIRNRARASYEANPGPKRESARKWMKNNPGAKATLDLRNRENRKRAAPKWLTKQQKAEINAIYTRARYLTGKTGVTHHVDHIEPIVGANSCGLHVPWNLQVLTETENIKKGNRLPVELVW